MADTLLLLGFGELESEAPVVGEWFNPTIMSSDCDRIRFGVENDYLTDTSHTMSFIERYDGARPAEVSRLSRSIRDLATTVERIVDEPGAGLHILDMNLAMGDGDDPYQRAFLNIMGTIAELESDMIRERVRSGITAAQLAGKHTERPPFGFDVRPEGPLSPNEKYDVAVEVLELGATGTVSSIEEIGADASPGDDGDLIQIWVEWLC